MSSSPTRPPAPPRRPATGHLPPFAPSNPDSQAVPAFVLGLFLPSVCITLMVATNGVGAGGITFIAGLALAFAIHRAFHFLAGLLIGLLLAPIVGILMVVQTCHVG